MAAQVKVEFNVPRSELVVPPFRKSILASTFKYVQWAANPAVGGIKATPGYLPHNLWQEPHTGVIMFRPYPLHNEYYNSSPGLLSKSDFTYSIANSVDEIAGKGNRIRVGRTARSSALVETMVDAAIAAVLTLFGTGMKQIFRTNTPLAINQGWSVWVFPPSIHTDRTVDYMCISFGARYSLRLRLNGVAALFVVTGYDTTTATYTWGEVANFHYNEAGIEFGRAFQITCTPFGVEDLSFVFSQTSEHAPGTRGSLHNSQTKSFHYYITHGEPGWTPVLSPTINHYIKYPSANVTISLIPAYYNVTFQFARITYPTVKASFYTWPETLNEQAPTNPAIGLFGYLPMSSSAASKMTTAGIITNHKQQAYNNATDFKLSPYVEMQATPDGLYTPELWSLDITRASICDVPDWTIDDKSTKWNYIRMALSSEGEAHTGELNLTRMDANFSTMLKPQGPPVRISMARLDGALVPVYEGYVDLFHPTLEAKFLHMKYELRDMWVRLNETYLDDFTFLDGQSLSNTISLLIQSAGFLSSDITITDTDGTLGATSYAGFRDPNDQKAIDPGKSVGEVLRHIQAYFWARPLRVLWLNGKWQVNLAPDYTYVVNTPPAYRFTLFLTDAELAQPDITRWTNKVYRIKGNLEFTVKPLAFNRLIVRTTTGVGSGAEGIQATITNRYPGSWYYKSKYDKTHPWFIGRTKSEVVMPPGVINAQAGNELEIFGRTYWDRYSRPVQQVEFRGEWLPDITIDTQIWITVISTTDGTTKVSVGAWRIDHIDIVVHADDPAKDVRYEHEARYTCTFIGKADNATYAMFTADTNLPLRDTP